MKRLLFCLLSCACVLSLLLCGCGTTGGQVPDFEEVPESSEEPVPEHVGFYNNLSGLYELDTKEKESARPVAIMINNISVAQKVQSGLGKASIVYESFAEGGITRLLAVFKDAASIPQVGSLRSARYSYIDLACGHDAVYVHCGRDPNYTLTKMTNMGLDNYDFNSGYGGPYCFRVDNGLAWEHRLFTNGELLVKALEDGGRRMTVDDKHSGAWANFADEDEIVKPIGSKAKEISVFFSASYVTNFKYDNESGLYLKFNRDTPNIDGDTGEQYGYKNLFVLFTNVGTFDDNYRVYSELKGGDGYYICNGSCQPIKWAKGDVYDSFKFTDEDGHSLLVNAGNSYVCLTSLSARSRTTIESGEPETSSAVGSSVHD